MADLGLAVGQPAELGEALVGEAEGPHAAAVTTSETASRAWPG